MEDKGTATGPLELGFDLNRFGRLPDAVDVAVGNRLQRAGLGQGDAGGHVGICQRGAGGVGCGIAVGLELGVGQLNCHLGAFRQEEERNPTNVMFHRVGVGNGRAEAGADGECLARFDGLGRFDGWRVLFHFPIGALNGGTEV